MDNKYTHQELPTETQEAYKFATWCFMNHKTKGYLLHFANEGKRTASYGHRLKRMGMRPGTADYFLAIPVKTYPGMFIELKRADKKKSLVSNLQKIFLEDMRKQGFHAVVAYGADEAIRYVEEYLGMGELCS